MRSQEEPGKAKGARRNQEEPGGARRSQVTEGGIALCFVNAIFILLTYATPCRDVQKIIPSSLVPVRSCQFFAKKMQEVSLLLSSLDMVPWFA